MDTDGILPGLITQLPIVAAFFWFVLRRDKAAEKARGQRDAEWRSFLKETGEANGRMLGRLAGEIEGLGKTVARNTAVTLCGYAANVSNGEAPDVATILKIIGD